ncbi:unnamed protein product [Linum trigynum]|uniref:Uncharacterized protein n=1 Tax=Linum trigynum TaxID=586398 RepID=A0AAV2FVB3_9ROSI
MLSILPVEQPKLFLFPRHQTAEASATSTYAQTLLLHWEPCVWPLDQGIEKSAISSLPSSHVRDDRWLILCFHRRSVTPRPQ